MKLILLLTTLLFLFSTIKSTPCMLSSKFYYKRIQAMLNNAKDTLYKYNELKKDSAINDEDGNFLYGIYILLFALFEMFMCIYYSVIVGIYSTNIFIIVLSILQIVTVFIDSSNIYKNPYKCNIDDYKFNRWTSLFNVVLCYIYYPTVIYMLFK